MAPEPSIAALPHVGVNRGDLPRPAAPLEERRALKVTHCDTYIGTIVGQPAYDMATQEPRTYEYGDAALSPVQGALRAGPGDHHDA